MATDMLRKALLRLRDLRELNLSETVVYHRAANSVSLSATRGSTSYEVADMDGLIVRARSTDFIITAASLILASVEVLPERGDKIVVTVGSDVFTYEVLDLGDAGHFRQADPQGITLRIFTKLITKA